MLQTRVQQLLKLVAPNRHHYSQYGLEPALDGTAVKNLRTQVMITFLIQTTYSSPGLDAGGSHTTRTP